jgi:hypothetical protein
MRKVWLDGDCVGAHGRGLVPPDCEEMHSFVLAPPPIRIVWGAPRSVSMAGTWSSRAPEPRMRPTVRRDDVD